MTADDLDGRMGEAWAGDVPNGAHINLVLARRGTPTAASIVTALASPRPGHMPYLACLEPGMVVRPITVVINKTTLGEATLDKLTWGAGQVGTAQGILDAVDEGALPAELADDIVVLVVLWLDRAAADETAVKAAVREAVLTAVRDAVARRDATHVEKLASIREKARTAYYTGR